MNLMLAKLGFLLLFGHVCFGKFVPLTTEEMKKKAYMSTLQSGSTTNKKEQVKRASPSSKAKKKTFHTMGGDEDHRMHSNTEYAEHAFYQLKYESDEDTIHGWQELSTEPNAVLANCSEVDDWPTTAVKVYLNGWNFNFYGHLHSTVYVDPNGFISMMPRFCPHLSFCNWGQADSQYTRYVAPMMTDFDPSFSDFSKIYYLFTKLNDKRRLIVQWTNLVLYHTNRATFSIAPDEPQHSWDLGNKTFTFQAVLEEDGDILFVYKNLPFDPSTRFLTNALNQRNTYYPLHIGLEDAAIVTDENDVSVTYLLTLSTLDFNFSDIDLHVSLRYQAEPSCPEVGRLLNRDTDDTYDEVLLDGCQRCANYTQNHKTRTGQTRCGWCRDQQVCADMIGREAHSKSSVCLKRHFDAVRVYDFDAHILETTMAGCAWVKPTPVKEIIREVKHPLTAGAIAAIIICIMILLAIIIYISKRLAEEKKKFEHYKKFQKKVGQQDDGATQIGMDDNTGYSTGNIN